MNVKSYRYEVSPGWPLLLADLFEGRSPIEGISAWVYCQRTFWIRPRA